MDDYSEKPKRKQKPKQLYRRARVVLWILRLSLFIALSILGLIVVVTMSCVNY